MLAKLISFGLFFVGLTSSANSACQFEELPRNRLVAGVLGNDHSGRFLESLVRDGGMLGNRGLVRDAFLQSIAPSQENSERLVRAGVIYSEILIRWNRSISGFSAAADFVSDDFKKHGMIESIVFPLISLVEVGMALNRSDIASIANVGLAELNPTLANRFCSQFSLDALDLSQLPLPTRSNDLAPETRLAFSVHSYFNSIPSIARADSNGMPAGGMEAVVGDGSAWKHQLIASGGANEKPTRTECHIACNWKAIGSFTTTLVAEFGKNVLSDTTGRPGPDGKPTDLVFPASMHTTGKEAGEKADKSYEQTYENCMKQCPTPEPVPVKRNDQLLDDKQKNSPEIPPQTKSDDSNKGTKEAQEEQSDNDKNATRDNGKASFGGGNNPASPKPPSVATPVVGKQLDPNDPRCVVNEIGPNYPKDCPGGRHPMDQLFEKLDCSMLNDPTKPPPDMKWCRSLQESGINFNPVSVPQSRARLDERQEFLGRLATEINGLELSERPHRDLSSDERDKIIGLMNSGAIWQALNGPTRSALRGLVR